MDDRDEESPDQDALLERARAGDGDALATLLQRYAVDLHRVADRALPPRARSLLTADDILQQTFTDAFLGIAGFEPCGPDALRAWLRTLTRNNARDALRGLDARKRGGGARQGRSLDDSMSSLSDLLLAETRTTPSQHAARGEEIEALRKALDRLPEHHRNVIERYDLRGDPIETLAVELGRTVGAVYLLRNRAHRRLREILLLGREPDSR